MCTREGRSFIRKRKKTWNKTHIYLFSVFFVGCFQYFCFYGETLRLDSSIERTQHVVDENYARLKDGQHSTQQSEVKWNSCRNEIIAWEIRSQTLKSIKCRMKLIIDWQIHYIHKTHNRLRSLSSFAWFSVSFLSSGRVLVFSLSVSHSTHFACWWDVDETWNKKRKRESSKVKLEKARTMTGEAKGWLDWAEFRLIKV